MTSQLLIISPKPKPFCGVTDHSYSLARELEALNEKAKISGLDGLSDLQADSRVLVQVSIYGFQPKGLPYALIDRLHRFHRNGGRFVSYFHELWVPAANPISSAYWLRPMQQWICRWLALRSEQAHFNSPWAFNWGKKVIGSRASYSPTFSNVGHLLDAKSLKERPPRIVFFGAPLRRQEAYKALLPAMSILARSGLLREVIDIGDDPSVMPQAKLRSMGLAAYARGYLCAKQVSAELSEARYGAHYTPWSLASKSGIYGALISHGVVPISMHKRDTLPLSVGPPLAELRPVTIGPESWIQILQSPHALQTLGLELARAQRHYKSPSSLAKEIRRAFSTNTKVAWEQP